MSTTKSRLCIVIGTLIFSLSFPSYGAIQLNSFSINTLLHFGTGFVDNFRKLTGTDQSVHLKNNTESLSVLHASFQSLAQGIDAIAADGSLVGNHESGNGHVESAMRSLESGVWNLRARLCPPCRVGMSSVPPRPRAPPILPPAARSTHEPSQLLARGENPE